MVGSRHLGRMGGSTFGCLFSLLLFGSTVYYGLPIGHSYWRYTQLRDDMKTIVRFAQSIPDDQIVRQLQLTIEKLGLPQESRRVRVMRNGSARRIAVESAWTESITLPFKVWEYRYVARVEGVY